MSRYGHSHGSHHRGGGGVLVGSGAVALVLLVFVVGILYYTIFDDSDKEVNCGDSKNAVICAPATLSDLQIVDSSTVTLEKRPAEYEGGEDDYVLTYRLNTTNNSDHEVKVTACESYPNLDVTYNCMQYFVPAHASSQFDDVTHNEKIKPGHLADFDLIDHTYDTGTLVTRIDYHPITGK